MVMTLWLVLTPSWTVRPILCTSLVFGSNDAPKDDAFADALANGLRRFAQMIGADKYNLDGIKPAKLRSHIKQKLK